MEKIKTYKAPFYYLFHLWIERKKIMVMAVHDFKNHYIQSYLGIFWAYFQPLFMMAVILIIFSLGLRGKPGNENDVPFSVYFICGYIAWMFFSTMITGTSDSIKAFSFLIKKVDFPLFILPAVKIVSALFVHIVMILFLFGVVAYKGFYPSIYWIQIIYFVFAAVCLILGIGWFTASVSIFIGDIKQFIPVVIQLGFWGTPIFWNMERFPVWAQHILKLNPAYYIVNGYRDSMVYHKWFWEDPYLSLYYWGVVLLFWFIGSATYKNTRPHFAEVI